MITARSVPRTDDGRRSLLHCRGFAVPVRSARSLRTVDSVPDVPFRRSHISGLRRGRSFFEGPSSIINGLFEVRHPRSFLQVPRAKCQVPSAKCGAVGRRASGYGFYLVAASRCPSGRRGPFGRSVPCPTSRCQVPSTAFPKCGIPDRSSKCQEPSAKCKVLSAKCGAVGRRAS